MRHLLALVLALAAAPVLAGVIEGRVIEVPDGDTLTVLSREGSSIHRIRLAGIDAPGIDRAHGGSARESLRRMARGKNVRVETAAFDAKGLLIGVVQIIRDPRECAGKPCEERIDPGLTQLTSGLATIDKSNLSHQSEETQRRYAFAQAHAQAAKIGMWRPLSSQPQRTDFRYGEGGGPR